MFDVLALQRYYHQLYFRLMPFASAIVARYGRHNLLTERDINRMVAELLIVSKIMGAQNFGFSSNSIMDLARILILLNLYNNGYVIDPFWLMFFGNSCQFLLRPCVPPMRPTPPIPVPLPPIRPTPPRPIMPPVIPPMRPTPPIPAPLPPHRPSRPPFNSPRPGFPSRPPVSAPNRPRPFWR